MAAEEIFDVVDENDRVLRQASRRDVHAGRLLHRAVSVFVFNRRGQLLLQKRAASKDQYPLCYTSSASGHLEAGESYDQCAPRELQEELGLNPPLERLAKFPGGPETSYEHTVLYRTVTDQKPRINHNEIESGTYFDLEEIRSMMERNPAEFTPPFRALFHWYLENAPPLPKS